MHMEPIRDHFIFLPELFSYLLYALALVSLILFSFLAYRRIRLYGGLEEFSFRNSLLKLRLTIESERRFISEKYGGFAHSCIVIGFIILLIGTCIIFVEHSISMKFFNERILVGASYIVFEFILDLGGLVFLIGVSAALVRRVFFKPERLTNEIGNLSVLLLLLFIGVSGFVLEGHRLVLKPVPWGIASFVGFGFSKLFQSLGLVEYLGVGSYRVLWWSHAIISILGGVIILTQTRLRHALLFFVGRYRSLKRWSTPFVLSKVLESKKFDARIGVHQAQEFSWTQKVDLDACTDCGRCQDVCPAFRAGGILSPKEVIHKVHSHLPQSGDTDNIIKPDIVSHYVSDEEIELCLADGACSKACPSFINPLDYIIELRRHQVMNLGKPPGKALFNILLRDNPYGLPRSERVSWKKDLKLKILDENEKVDVLYWIGCAGSYDARAQKIAHAMVKILEAAHVNFAIIKDEGCCGDLARRMGDEYLFQEIVLRNIEKLRKYTFETLLVNCPHGYNVFRNDYRDFGFETNVTSHIEFLDSLLMENKLKLTNPDLIRTVTYHDSCFLRLYNNISDPARRVIDAIKGLQLVEMKEFFCCGGGGGGSWTELPRHLRSNLYRIEDAMAVNPDIIVTAYPYCANMLEDAVKVKGAEGKVLVKDLVEIVAEVVG